MGALLKVVVHDIEDYDLPMFGAFHNCAFIKIGLSGCEMGSSYHLPRLIETVQAVKKKHDID